MSRISMKAALHQALRAEMRRDPNVFVAGEDVTLGALGVTGGLVEEFGPERVRDTPISEAAIAGLAVGAAACGLRPVVEILLMDFLGVAMDQICNQAAKMRYMYGGKARLPLVVRMACGAGMGRAAQHSQSLEAWVCHTPGLKVVMPSTPRDARGLLVSAIQDDNPVIFVEHRALYNCEGEVPDEDYAIPLSQAEVKRPGRNITVVALSRMVHEALAAAEDLAGAGVDVEVIDPRTLVPLDIETILESVTKTGRLVIVHEGVWFCGFGAEIAASVGELAFEELAAPIRRVAPPFTPVPFSPPLEREYLPDREDIAAAVMDVLAYRPPA